MKSYNVKTVCFFNETRRGIEIKSELGASLKNTNHLFIYLSFSNQSKNKSISTNTNTDYKVQHILMPRLHQSLNMFKSCLVKHGCLLMFFDYKFIAN